MISRDVSVSLVCFWNVLEYSFCVDFMHEALLDKGTILIHCMAGISRSTTITCVYLMTATSLGMEVIMKAIKLKRDVVNPNGGFLKQMRDYERDDLRKRLESDINAILAV